MNDIICPHCKKAFKVDEAGFADILKQVRDGEFENELHDRIVLLEKEKNSAVKLAEVTTKNEMQSSITQKDVEIANLKAQKDSDLAHLRAQIQSAEIEKKLALSEAVGKLERERDQIANDLKTKDTEKQLLETSLKEKFESEIKGKDEMIAYYRDMKARLSTKMVGETLEQH